MRYDYAKNTPLWLKIALFAAGLLALVPIANLVFMGVHNLTFAYRGDLSISALGQLGDFFGGHTAAFAGSTSLVVVLFFTFHQAHQQAHFFAAQQREASQNADRNSFLQGINLITQLDLASPGCDQCLRLLDYYGRLALKAEDRELSLLLNTVITAKIRKNLEGKNGSFRQTNYPYACEIMKKIAQLREEDGRAANIKRRVSKA